MELGLLNNSVELLCTIKAGGILGWFSDALGTCEWKKCSGIASANKVFFPAMCMEENQKL